jgi:hypothetical protein
MVVVVVIGFGPFRGFGAFDPVFRVDPVLAQGSNFSDDIRYRMTENRCQRLEEIKMAPCPNQEAGIQFLSHDRATKPQPLDVAKLIRGGAAWLHASGARREKPQPIEIVACGSPVLSSSSIPCDPLSMLSAEDALRGLNREML